MRLLSRRPACDGCVRDTTIRSFRCWTAAWTTGATAEAKDAPKRNKFSHTGTCGCRVAPLSFETHGRVGPEAFALLNEIAEYTAAVASASKNIFLQNAPRDLTTAVCPGVIRPVTAA